MNSTAAVVPFFFQSHEVRTTMIEDAPWFVARDVCDVLEMGTEQIRRLDDDEKGLRKVQTLGGEQEMAIISESGLYTLVMRSNKPQAKPFRKWVTAEVLPTIRKTGGYILPTIPRTPPLFSDQEMSQALTRTREGEWLLRELRIGIGVARAVGIGGRRRVLEEAAREVVARCGIDPLAYFHVDLETLFPRLNAGGEVNLLAEFVAAELEPADSHQQRVSLKAAYGRFRTWYAEQVDHRLRGLPTLKAMAGKLRAEGLTLERRGGRHWLTGVRLTCGEV